MCVLTGAYVHACVGIYVDVHLCICCIFLYVCVCVWRVAGCLPVFSLAGLHTAAWQQKAGQLNSLDGEKRARGRGRGGGGRDGVRREVEGL